MWSEGQELPNDVMGNVQCVVVEDELFVSHTYADLENIEPDKIMRFSDKRWTVLPSLRREKFAIACLKGQLFVSGGIMKSASNQKSLAKKLLIWAKTKKAWLESEYPEMPEGRFNCCAVGHGATLVIVGGWTQRKVVVALDTILLLDTEARSFKWHMSRVCMPLSCHSMKCVVVGDNLYFMGGNSSRDESRTSHETRTSHVATDKVYSVEFSSLSRHEKRTATEVKSPGSFHSTPLSHEGSLFALGGKCERDIASNRILKLRRCGLASDDQDEVEEWVEVGTLCQAMWNCVCGVVGNVLVVSGGEPGKDSSSTTTYLAQLK